MRRSRLTFLRPTMLALGLTAGCSVQGTPYLLGSHPKVEFGMEIEPAAEIWTVREDGTLFRSGRKVTLEEARSPSRQKDADPILIEVGSGKKVEACVPALLALVASHRSNISFLVSTGSSHRRVVLPVPVARGQGLIYRVGAIEYRDPSEDTKHPFLRGRVDPSGNLRAESLTHCSYPELRAIKFPVDEEDTGQIEPSSRDQKPGAWQGKRPPFGVWSLSTLRDFMASPEVRTLNPVVILEVEPADKIQDFLSCLDKLHQVAYGNTVVEIPQPR